MEELENRTETGEEPKTTDTIEVPNVNKPEGTTDKGQDIDTKPTEQSPKENGKPDKPKEPDIDNPDVSDDKGQDIDKKPSEQSPKEVDVSTDKEKVSEKEKEQDEEKEAKKEKDRLEEDDKNRKYAEKQRKKEEKEKQKREKEATSRKKEFFLKRLLKKAWEMVRKIPSKIVDNIAYMVSPKEVKLKMYEKALEEHTQELKSKKQEKLKETEKTRTKKREIVQDKNISLDAKVKSLSLLCYETNQVLYVPTPDGALRFTKDGKDIFIAYADREKPTAESPEIYAFRTISHARIKDNFFQRLDFDKKETSIENVLTYLSNQNGFHEKMTDLPSGCVKIDGEIYGTDTNGPKVELEDSKLLEQAIITGDTETLDKIITKMLTEQKKEFSEQDKADIQKAMAEKDYYKVKTKVDQLFSNAQEDVSKSDDKSKKNDEPTNVDEPKQDKPEPTRGDESKKPEAKVNQKPEQEPKEPQKPIKNAPELETLDIITNKEDEFNIPVPKSIFEFEEEIVYSDPEDAGLNFGDLLHLDEQKHPERYNRRGKGHEEEERE